MTQGATRSIRVPPIAAPSGPVVKPPHPLESYGKAVDAVHDVQGLLGKLFRDNDRHGTLQAALSANRRAEKHILALIDSEESGS